MKSMMMLSMVTAVSMFVVPAHAGSVNPDYDSWYVGFDLMGSTAGGSSVSGTSRGMVNDKATFGIGDVKVGYRPAALYSDRGDVRFEAELATRGLGVDSVRSGGVTSHPGGELGVTALMLNGYYDLHTGTAFTPYVGAGVGAAVARFSKLPGMGITDKSSDRAAAAGQIALGVSYTPEFLAETEWSIGYNYFTTGNLKFKTKGDAEKLDGPGISSVQLGFKYHF